MKLGTKVLLTIFLTWTVMVGATYFGSTTILERSYAILEDQQEAKDLNQVHQVINAFLLNNDANLEGWAAWDEMYKYAANHSQAFITANITPSALAVTNIDLFMIYDTHGTPLFAKELNTDRSQFLTVPVEIASLFQSGGELNRIVTLPETDNDTIGLIFVPSRGIIGFASRRILTTAVTGPAHGTDISMQYITDAIWQQFKKTSKLDMQLYTLPQIKTNPELNNEYAALLAKKQDSERIDFSKKTMLLYTVLRDINNHPIAMIKVIVPRYIRSVGAQTVFYFNVALIATGIIFALLLFYLLRFLIVKRLEKMNNRIVQVNAKKDFSIRVPQSGKDELSSVGAEMNKMLSIIESVEATLTDMINSMPSMLIIVDKNINITDLNHLAEKEAGSTSNELKGKALFDYFPYLSSYKEKFIELLKNKKPQELDKVIFTQNDISRHFRVIIYPLTRSEEQNIAVRIDDISEQHKINEQIMQNDKLASINILTAGVSYEMREPINVISNDASSLEKNIRNLFILLNKYKDMRPDENFSKELAAIEKIKSETDLTDMTQTINQLIQNVSEKATLTANIVKYLKMFSRLEEDSMKRTDIHEGINSILVLLRYLYKDRIEVIKEYGHLDEIDCFPGKLNQVFINIILNAIDAIPAQGKITIRTEQTGDTVNISIKDTGIGIKKENEAKIFDPFFTTKDVTKGTGLGLSIAASIIHDHHGTIQVHSEANNGTEINITLPINQAESYTQ